MERTKKENDPEIRWIKQGGGSVRLGNGRIIKPNQKFTARVSEVPTAFRDVIVPVNAKESAEINEKTPDTSLEYFVVHLAGGWYNVVDNKDKVQNEKKLRRDDAEALLKTLVEK